MASDPAALGASNGAPLYIDERTVQSLLTVGDLMQPLEFAFAAYSYRHLKPEGLVQPVRNMLSVQPHGGFLAVMPGYVGEMGAMATKLVTFYPTNRAPHKTHQAWIMLMDPRYGNLLSIVDGDSVTAIRTAAASAIATKYLASSDSRVLAILGSGVQARSHIEALTATHHYVEIRVWSRTEANARKLCDEVGAVYCSSVEEAVRGADVVCTVTFSTTPIVKLQWLKNSAHVNAVGACRPDWSELEPELMRSAVVYCDTREACLQESGDVILSQCEVYAELGEVIKGDKEKNRERLTVFKSLGMAVEDVVSAKIVYEKYCEHQELKK